MSNFLKTARAFVIDEFSSCDQFIQFHLSKYRFKLNYIGIDCEWVNNEDQERVALLQIATPMNDCFLVRLCKMSGQMPQIVKEILEDKAVVKFGVGIQNDAKRLKMIGIHAQGCVDLRDVAHLENRDQSCQEMSLDALAKRILGVALNKSQGIQCSNWEQEKLSSQQIEYAANDALVAIHMFLTLVKEKVKQSSDVNDFSLGEKNVSLRGVSNEDLADGFGYTVNLSQFESGEREGYLATKEVRNLISHPDFAQTAGLLCQDLIDIPFKERKRKPVSKFEHSISSDPEKFQKPSKDDKTRKSPLYKDCILTAPDGSRLCTLDDKKADWYIDRGLGHLTNLDPYTVQLNFEPAGRPDDYDLNFKDNVCVVCGSGESYMRKRIIPHEYRRQFPLEMKVHQPHDILLTCPRCHSLANFFDDQLRKELAIKYNAPLEMFHVEDPKLREVKWAAKGLSDGGNRIPEDRRKKLSHIVQKHFSASPLTPEMISQAATMETLKENANFVSHGFEVVERFRSEGKLLEFEKMWRKHFFDTMQPKFLPSWWSVDHRHEILEEKIHSDVGR